MKTSSFVFTALTLGEFLTAAVVVRTGVAPLQQPEMRLAACIGCGNGNGNGNVGILNGNLNGNNNTGAGNGNGNGNGNGGENGQ